MTADLRTGRSLALLTTVPGIGPRRALRIAETCANWADVQHASDPTLAKLTPASTIEALRAVADGPDQIDLGTTARPISIYDADYPDRLRAIPDPPPLLWCHGTTPSGHRLIAIVGTRHPTPSGQRITTALAQLAARRGIGIVSGLAVGVDSLAAEAAVTASAPTWAYLGQGVDSLDPRSARGQLAQRILDTGGGILSEVHPATPYGPAHLLTQRNRLQTGSTDLTLIAQTGAPTDSKRPGTMHTARFAILQHRPLAVVAPPAAEHTETEWAGNVALLDPAGCHSDLVYANGKDAPLVAAKRPAADAVIDTLDRAAEILDGITAVATRHNSADEPTLFD